MALLDQIFSPGAMMSTHFPRLEKWESVPSMLLYPTVITVGSRAGD